MTYERAFAEARRACSQFKTTIHVLHAPQYSDSHERDSYEFADQSARAMLMPLAQVVVTLRPIDGGVEVFPSHASNPRA
jgi:hypothetical protein